MPNLDPRKLPYAHAVTWDQIAITSNTTASTFPAIPAPSSTAYRIVVTHILAEITNSDTSTTDLVLRTQGVAIANRILNGTANTVDRWNIAGDGLFLGDPGFSVEINIPANAARTRTKLLMVGKYVPV